MSLPCLRCGTQLAFAGTREFHEGTRWGFLGDWGELFVNKEAFDVYYCPHCGKIEFFLAGRGEGRIKPRSVDVLAPRPAGQTTGEATLAHLHELQPGTQRIPDLFQYVGYPSVYRQVGSCTALRYAARSADMPDVVVVDKTTGELKMVAIANVDNSFSLSDLIAEHGEPVIAGIFNGNEHHFFAERGLAIVATGRAESDILYVQVLPAKLTLNEYIAADGYAAETLIFSSS